MATVTADAPSGIESVALVLSDSDVTGYLDTGLGGALESGLGDFLAAPPHWRGATLEWVSGTRGATVADSNAPIEVTAIVGASVLDPWSSDFSTDFGPGSVPATGASSPIEVLSRAQYGLGVIIEDASGLFRADIWPAIEAGTTTRAGHAHPPTEALLIARRDPPVAGEALITALADMLPSVEATMTARADPVAPTEIGLMARGGRQPPVELLTAAARADALAQLESLSMLPPVQANSFAPIEALGTIRGDNAPIEWLALFRNDASGPAELLLLVRIDPPTQAESAAISRGDAIPPLEAPSAAARSDPVIPSEALLSAVSDGAYIELLAGSRSDSPAAAEAGSTLRADPNIPAEAVAGAARADASIALEQIVGVLRGAAPPPIEFLSVVRSLLVVGDSKMPLEWLETVLADKTPIVEWSALSLTDRLALVEWFRTMAVDASPPAESRATAPAPLTFVSRGRLRG